MRIAAIALPVPISTTFDYFFQDSVDDETNYIGCRVLVPFGHRTVVGIVVGIKMESEYPIEKLKTITRIIDPAPIFSSSLWQVLLWASRYYLAPIGEVLFHALPVLLRQGQVIRDNLLIKWEITEKGKQTITSLKGKNQRNVLMILQERPIYDNELVLLAIKRTTLMNLEKKGLIIQKPEKSINKDWYTHFVNKQDKALIQLNDQQKEVINAIEQTLSTYITWLLAGITGSGKTEIYLTVIEQVLAQGKAALVLVPEIGLTPQTIDRFKHRFNAPIAVLHSKLNNTERLTVWAQASQGEVAIIIGTRSAIFTPFANLGIIIIDEEHDVSYKQQDGWKYHARDLAIVRAKEENIPVILGSATPALESLNNCKMGKYRLIKLDTRPTGSQLAQQVLFDLKGVTLTSGLSPQLINKIKQHIAADNQVLIFLNRRGFAPVLLCHECGWIAACPRCDKYYTFHAEQHQLACHHCDSKKMVPVQCPGCGSTQLLPIGVGTEQLEKTLSSLMPDVPVIRIDSDTTNRKHAMANYMNTIRQGGAKILIGTQLLAKGHHFPDVTLVALVDVDSALFSTDFRATERFAQLYTQVSGRAGRAQKKGEVILQTHHPHHPLLETLLHQGYEHFAEQTLFERQGAGLPPFAYQIIFRAESHKNEDVFNFLLDVKTIFNEELSDPALWCLGPMPATLAKRRGKYRWQLLFQHVSRQQLHLFIESKMNTIMTLPLAHRVRWALDVDPIESV